VTAVRSRIRHAPSRQAPAAGQAAATGPEGDLTVRGLVRLYPGGGGVDGLDLVAEKGQLISLLGASGCGKTTTLRCLAGIDTPDGGEVWIDGKLVSSAARKISMPPERREIGMVFQSYALWPHLTAVENVAFPLRARKLPRREARQRAQAMLDLVGLGQLAERSPGQLSGGQQQRVALARALVYQPRLLLFDEPLSNLDAELRESVRQDIRRIQRELTVTALYVTHDRTEAMAISDRLVVMAKGKIVQDGPPRELLDRPASPFVAALLGSANMIHGTVERAGRDAAGAAVTIVAGPPGNQARLHARASEPLEAGSKAVVCIRPTALRIEPAASNAARDHAIAGKLRDSYPTGPEFEHLVEVGGTVLKVLATADRGLISGDSGDEVRIWYSPGDAICFPITDQPPPL
jgi:iron(III) transport system ATP-binding protein